MRGATWSLVDLGIAGDLQRGLMRQEGVRGGMAERQRSTRRELLLGERKGRGLSLALLGAILMAAQLSMRA